MARSVASVMDDGARIAAPEESGKPVVELPAFIPLGAPPAEPAPRPQPANRVRPAATADLSVPVAPIGHLESLAVVEALGLCVLTGWMSDPPAEGDVEFRLVCDQGLINRFGTIAFFDRFDIRPVGRAFVAVAGGVDSGKGDIVAISFAFGALSCDLVLHPKIERPVADEAIAVARRLLGTGTRSAARTRILRSLAGLGYAGGDTLDRLPLPAMIEFDVVYLCPPAGVVVRGWMADPFAQIARMRMCSGHRGVPVDLTRAIPIARPDVIETLGPKFGFFNEDCGFMLYVPDLYRRGEALHIELETMDGEVVYRPLPAPRRTGFHAMREMLDGFAPRPGRLDGMFDAIGPALAALNAARLAEPPRYRRLDFGPASASDSADVRCSLVIPLHGRLDFMQYQLAGFARTLPADCEVIYVLDEPARRAEAEALARACAIRFGQKFVLLALEANLGFGPASNVGLGEARGAFVCFLNSDVFPAEPDWLDRLCAAAAEPDVGCAGPLLVFEDGSVQHRGVVVERLAACDDWHFALHPGKGRAVPAQLAVRDVPAVTGACLTMRRDLAREIGGFDPRYAVGDFEDVDLCFRLRARGLRCVVDERARLYHLERQSQGDMASRGRQNLTLFNAWQFERRWFASQSA